MMLCERSKIKWNKKLTKIRYHVRSKEKDQETKHDIIDILRFMNGSNRAPIH